jgi:hypothetical protein
MFVSPCLKTTTDKDAFFPAADIADRKQRRYSPGLRTDSAIYGRSRRKARGSARSHFAAQRKV